MKKFLFIICIFLTELFSASVPASGQVMDGAATEDDKVDVAGILFGHIGDSYGWHITDWNGRHITVPLPCIVHSNTNGWHIFMSSKIMHGQVYEGFFVAEDGKFKDKLVELGPDGEYVRPLDISITKNVCSLIFSSFLLLLIVLTTAHWYRKHNSEDEAPGGIAKVMEPLIISINESLVKDNIGKDYKKYSPYLLTVFFFILVNNIIGIIPFFPGGANVTGNIAVTLVLALCTFIAVNLFANKHYWKDILWPDVPLFLKFPIPLMPLIEIFGMFTKPLSLMVRLFANILAGHAMILGLVSIIFIVAKMGPVICGSMTLATMLIGVFMDCLELLVAFIQAYVFTMLSAVFIGMSRSEAE